MTQIRKMVALSAAVAGLALCPSVFAQDDLDDLLKDLESESETPATAPAAVAEEPPAATEPAAEEATAEGESAADEAAAEEPTAAEEPAAAEEPTAAEEPAAEEEPTAAEEPAATEEPAAEEPAAAEEPTAAEEPAAEEPAAEEPAAAEEPTAAEEPAPVSNEKVDEVLNLLDDLAASADEPKTAVEPAAEKPTEVKPTAEKPAVVAPAKANPEAELLSNLMTTERVRRQALDAQAKRAINEARECMKNAEYADAVRLYGNATKLLSDRAAVKNLRKECEQGIAEGLYRAALQENDLGRRERATQLMTQAVEMRHPRARRILEKWTDENATSTAVEDTSDKKHVKTEAKYKSDREQIKKHLKRSLQYLANRNIEKALEECEIVLVNDPSNQEAIRIRNAIQKKRQVILKQEREAARNGMIADVDEAWRPVYAVNAAQLNAQSAETIKAQTSDDPERTIEQDIERRMKEMKLPNISFKPPATIIDAVEFFRQASKDYDRPDIEASKRGFNFVLRTPVGAIKQQATSDDSDDFSSSGEDESAGPANGLEPISTITASDITFHEALKLVCDSVGYKFIVRGQVVMVMPVDMSTAELIARKYNVPEAFVERVNNAKDEIKSMGGGFGSSNASRRKGGEEEEGEEQDWKAFFEEMGVQWPDGSSIKHIKALGKLYVRNTRENLAEFEKVLDELGGQPQLIEIETRFVEVSQQDLNSLGFEWLLNSDYSLNVGERLGKALGIKQSTWGAVSDSQSVNRTIRNTVTDSTIVGSNGQMIPGADKGASYTTIDSYNRAFERSVNPYSVGGNLIRDPLSNRNVGINAFGGTDSVYGNNNRYLSTVGNHISGQSIATNDQFMRVNAFLGSADLSMILHMLSQRSDTDLLSAPKIVTKSGENAVIKVVTEYIYPQDYDVQLQSSSSNSGGSNGGGSQSAVLAVVEPQNFTMREVGVILDVTPTYSEANGGTIDLELKPQVVDEPTWKNYGMKIPFTGNSSLQNFEGIGGIFTGLAESIAAVGGGISDELKEWIITTETQAAKDALNGLTKSQSDNMTYYDAPMEQPFFHVRSIDSKVSITPGSTVVMGGLITEQRKAMDDKIPFLGDLPYIGRLFRSHAEQTNKRNLLIFVTGRLITPSGRELKMNEEQANDAEVKAAPSAE